MSTYRSCIVTTSGLLSLTMLGGLVLSSIFVSADTEVIDQVRLTVPVACTMSGTGTTHTATLNPGTYSGASGNEYENGIGKTTLTAICNDDNGFSIYAIGFTGNEYGVTNLIGQNTSGTIATKAYASGDTTSNWSMKLTKVDNPVSGDPVTYNPQNLTITTSYDTWHAVPAEYTKVAEYHANTGSSTTDTTLGVKLETTYAAYISSSQPADTYVGQVKYTMVHPYDEQPLQPVVCQSGKICYNANGSDIEGTMGQPTISTSATSATLLAGNFSRTGYGFAGWSNKFDYATNPTQEGIKFYGPNETISFTSGQYTGTNPGLSLYAVWIKSQGNLQDSSKVTSVCNGLIQAPTDGTANLSSVSAFTDQRDNETYAIAKLADGNCWMIENLRLENTNSDNSTGALAQGYNASFAGLADPEVSWANNSTTANSLYSTDGSTDNTISGDNQGYRFPRYNNVNTPTAAAGRPSNPTGNSAINSASNSGMYSYGNYYTLAAAVADTTNYTSGDHDTASICPTGWKMPLGKTSTGDIEQGASDTTNRVGSFSWLDRKIGGTGAAQSTAEASLRWRRYPNNIVYSGAIGSGSVSNRGSEGHYWSSSSTGGYAFYFGFYSGYVGPGISSSEKYNGKSIRCLIYGV